MAKASLTYREGDEPIPGYKLTKQLGQGGVGETWRATAPGGIEVALKVVSKLQEGGGRRELKGLEQIKNIRHNHICQTYGYWAKNAQGEIVEAAAGTVSATMSDTIIPEIEPTGAVQLLIAMELGEETLADVYARYRQQRSEGELGGIPVEELFHYIDSAGRAVDHLNRRHHICHCDLKPQNILLVGGEAKVCDFGLARQVIDAKKTTTRVFTPQYGAPEMMVEATYHPRMDQYSLALTYAELRGGRFPFPSFSQGSESQLDALAREKWKGNFDLSALPKAERKVIAKAMSPDPEDRYETIADMLDALHEAIYPAKGSGWLVKAIVICLLLAVCAAAIVLVEHLPPFPKPPPSGGGATGSSENPAGSDTKTGNGGQATQVTTPKGETPAEEGKADVKQGTGGGRGPHPPPPPPDSFRTIMAKAVTLARRGSEEDIRQAAELLGGLRNLAGNPQEHWEVEFLDVFLDLKSRDGKVALITIVEALCKLFDNPDGAQSVYRPNELLDPLATRLEDDLGDGKLDGAAVLRAGDLWTKDRPGGDTSDGSYVSRLETIFVVVLLGQDGLDYSAIEKRTLTLLQAAEAEVSPDAEHADLRRALRVVIAAAWAESVMGRGGSAEELSDPQRQKYVELVRQSESSGVYGDYVRFVRALLLEFLDEKRLPEAAGQLPAIFKSSAVSPALRTVRCRRAAVRLLARAVHALREPDADGIREEIFKAEKAATASEYLDLARELLKDELEKDVKLDSQLSAQLAEDFVLAFWSAGRDAKEVHKMANNVAATGSASGPVLAVRARAALKLWDAEPDPKSIEARDRVLQDHADLLDWLSKSGPDYDFREDPQKFLAKALECAGLEGLVKKLEELPIANLAPQLRSPEGEIQENLKLVRKPDSVALIFRLHGQGLRDKFDDTEQGLRRVLHAFAISAWLKPSAECLVEMGEILLRLHSLINLQGTQRDLLLKATKGLADDALRQHSGDHGVYALQGHLRLLQFRLSEADVETRKKLLEEAIISYERALDLSPPESLRRRYLVGKSATCLERAFLAFADRPVCGCDAIALVRSDSRKYLDMAWQAADAAKDLRFREDAPEEAWIAKANAEEDLAFKLGEKAQYEAACGSFSKAISEAQYWERTSVKAILGRGRCRLRQILNDPSGHGLTALEQEVIPDLLQAEAKAKMQNESPLLADIYFQLAEAYACWQLRYAPNGDDKKKLALSAYRQAIEIAGRTAPSTRPVYQDGLVKAAMTMGDAATAVTEAERLLEAADQGGIDSAIEYSALRTWMEGKGLTVTTNELDRARAKIEGHLQRFPNDKPLQAGRRVYLLGDRSRFTFRTAKPTDPLFDEAEKDALEALALAEAGQMFGESERLCLRGFAKTVLGEFLRQKASHIANSSATSAASPERFDLATKSYDYLKEALKDFGDYHQKCNTDPRQALEETVLTRLNLGLVIQFHLLRDPNVGERRGLLCKEGSAEIAPLKAKGIVQHPALRKLMDDMLEEFAKK